MELEKPEIEKLISLRKEIHKNPDIAGSESGTAERVVNYLSLYNPDKIIKNIGGNGVAAIFKGKSPGPAVMIRCELDALPIKESNMFEYKSSKENISHKCGHDGHMTMVMGLAPLLYRGLNKGSVILLFQPAEETGEGAARVINDPKFKSIMSDYIFALHNLPGYKEGSIVIGKETFASASKGMIIKLIGKTSHAAEPENGISPAKAMAKIINLFSDLTSNLPEFKDFILVTVIHAKLGERAFGTSPGYAEVMATLRSFRNDDMEKLSALLTEKVREIAYAEKLHVDFDWTEEFPATINNDECVAIIREAASENSFTHTGLNLPFRWSEDFGHFTESIKGAMFGLGSGINHPQLHNPDYDFPDSIIPVGTKMFYSIIQKLLK